MKTFVFFLGWIPDYYSFNYNHVVFFYLPSLNEEASDSTTFIYAILSTVLVVALPYLLMVSQITKEMK